MLVSDCAVSGPCSRPVSGPVSGPGSGPGSRPVSGQRAVQAGARALQAAGGGRQAVAQWEGSLGLREAGGLGHGRQVVHAVSGRQAVGGRQWAAGSGWQAVGGRQWLSGRAV
eukprot:7993936-Pyramimonas_sp.AAC.1